MTNTESAGSSPVAGSQVRFREAAIMVDTTHRGAIRPPHTERKERVLVVDDDEEIRHLLVILFETEGFDVVGEAADGPNGLALAIRTEPDFIVLDYMMPGMDGAETAHLLKAMAPESRIIAFSAVLTEKPDWADAFLDKNRITEIAPLLSVLASAVR